MEEDVLGAVNPAYKHALLERFATNQLNENPLTAAELRAGSRQLARQVFLTVFASDQLPLHVMWTREQDDFYRQHAGSDMLGVPHGDEQRLQRFPQVRHAR